MVTWPEYLEGAMKRARIATYADLARRAGVTDSLISRWRRGVVTPSLDKIRPVAEALNRPFLEVAVAAGALSAEEARMKQPPEAPTSPVGAGVDPDVLADLEVADKDTVAAIRAMLKAAKPR